MVERRRLKIVLVVLAWPVMLLTTAFNGSLSLGTAVFLADRGDPGDTPYAAALFALPFLPSTLAGIAAVVFAHRSVRVGSPRPLAVALLIVATVVLEAVALLAPL